MLRRLSITGLAIAAIALITTVNAENRKAAQKFDQVPNQAAVQITDQLNVEAIPNEDASVNPAATNATNANDSGGVQVTISANPQNEATIGATANSGYNSAAAINPALLQ